MGYIIVIEGTDGCGKQTQTERLYNKLVELGYNVKRQSFPNYSSPSSEPVKMYLGGQFGNSDTSLDAYQASVLFAVDRLCTYKQDLQSFYENGGIIIFDRYVESNMLHQAGKISDPVQADKYCDWLDELEFDVLKLPRPNKIIFLDVPVEVSIKLAHDRGQLKANTPKDIHEQNPDHLLHAYNSGKRMSKKYNWNVVNCVQDMSLRSIESIAQDVFNIVKEDLERSKKWI